MIAKGGYVYIVSNPKRTVLYTGVTSNLYSRATDHKNGRGGTFSSKYVCTDLIYFEFIDDIESAILREKQIKKWKRAWKERLINEFNPSWRDLYNEIENYQ